MKQIKTMKVFRQITNVIVVISFLLCVASTMYGFIHLGNETDDTIVTYTVSFVSFFVSLVALVVALRTFFSIDAVNSITSMAGNVLQNENYSVSYPKIVKDLSLAKNEQEFTDKVLKSMYFEKKNTATCVEYADWLQNIIDNLIWIAYVNTSDTNYRVKRDQLIKVISNEYAKYSELSNGIQYTLHEHLELIKNVLKYIEWSDQQNNNFSNISSLEDIRGGLIQNPVSRTVYYDYVGLSYHKKAKTLITETITDFINSNERTSDFYKTIYDYQFDDLEMTHLKLILEKSMQAYDKAREASQNDIIWEGYIRYNRLRVMLLKSVITANNDFDELEHEIAEVKSLRQNIKYLYADTDSYISDCFNREIILINELSDAFTIFHKNMLDSELFD